jgi:DNA-binding MarR family transcriptional regulator
MDEKVDVERCDPFQLIAALVRGGRVVDAQLDAALATVALSGAKWSLLRELVEVGEPVPFRELAARLACVKSNVTQLVDRLEAEHLVRRTPDPADRRTVLAELTGAGRQRYEAGLEVVGNFERQLLEAYSVEERMMLHTLLTRLEGRASIHV